MKTEEPKDRPFDPYVTALSANAKAVVLDVLNQLQNFEKHFSLRSRGRRKADQETFKMQIEALVCDLIHRELTAQGGWLAIPFSKGSLGAKDRYKSKVLTKTLPDVIRNLSSPELAFLELRKGRRSLANRSESRQTTVRAGDRLKNCIKDYGLSLDDLGVHRNQETIQLRSAKVGYFGKPKKLNYEDTPQTIAYREQLESINHWLLQADITYLPDGTEDKPVDTSKRSLYRVFSNGSFQQGGRLYGGFWISLSKKQRLENLLIDGSPVVSLDFKNMHPRILYGIAGIKPSWEDAYSVSGMEQYREGIKQVFGAMLNTGHPLRRFPRNVKPLFPRRWSIGYVTEKVLAFHDPISSYLFSNLGLQVTFKESQVTLALLEELKGRGIVGLPIHDALIVPTEHKEETRKIMIQIFKEMIGVDVYVSVEGEHKDLGHLDSSTYHHIRGDSLPRQVLYLGYP